MLFTVDQYKSCESYKTYAPNGLGLENYSTVLHKVKLILKPYELQGLLFI